MMFKAEPGLTYAELFDIILSLLEEKETNL